MIDGEICKSNEKCWGDGICDPVLNNAKHCFDGGDCTYRYPMDYREPCNNYECCSPGAVEQNCGT